MENANGLFIWSDNWWLENDNVWFVGGAENVLFRLNLKTNECESAVGIPEETTSKFRLTPFILKCGDDIFCMPDNGNCIWVYNVCSEKFRKISINNPNNVRVGIYDFWEYDNKLFMVSNGLNQVIEIDITKKKIEKYYKICREGSIRKSIRVGTKIYSLSGKFNEVYQFDIITKEVNLYKLPNIGRKFSTLCFDGEKFWLSGYCKEIYVWNKEGNTIIKLDGFSKEFGIYNFSKNTDGKIDYTMNEYELPTFLYSISVGESIWFIPFQTNKIIYVNIQSHEIEVFEVAEEEETKESLLERTSLLYKYILEYVRENRYIGLFSLKNNCILEIDTLTKNVKMNYYTLSEKCMYEMSNIYHGQRFYESNKSHTQLFKYLLSRNMKNAYNIIDGNIGIKIYDMIN